VKSGRNADGRRMNVPSERILVEDCEFRAGHGGVTVGSEISAGVREVYAQRLRMTSPALDVALRFKTNSMRGGFVDGFHARDIAVGSVARAVVEVDLDYEEGPGHGYNPTIRDLDLRDLRVRHARRALTLRGYPDAPLRDVRLTSVVVQTAELPDVVEHVEGLVMRDVSCNGQPLPDTPPTP
jgi:polygalacturonase